ncbi:MAG TPA: metalloregulator ArsR/SmtB family transcription factor [Longimicrobium sp.]|jgi:ArsR family transcriptional regulator|uniref:ArsR/SmtB family transcription factor n=1 Tax=Longimicrobium sp. TaxID=2029185 RepID=UPI002EDA6C05
MSASAPAIFDRMSALADATRSRLLLVLERHELTVGELCQVLQLPQSTVSRHLKLLGDEGWVSARAEGTSRRYRMPADRLDADARQLWQLVRREVAGLAGAAQDAERLRSVLAQRSTRSREFFSSAAGEWDRLRADLFGRRADLLGLLGLVDEAWTVGDLGCGTGQMAASLAPFVARVIAVDGSPAMLEAARARLAGTPNVEVREGELESLPIDSGTLDAAVAFLVLHYVAEPADALAQAARALKPGGRLLVVDMMPHDREEYRQAMGHVWQGFEAERLGGWMADAGLTAFRYVPLPPDPAAKGPTLFAASARRGSA